LRGWGRCPSAWYTGIYVTAVFTGEKQQFGAACASLYGGLHQSCEAELVALVDTHSSEMMQQIADDVVVPWQRSINQSINQSIDQSINQSVNQ